MFEVNTAMIAKLGWTLILAPKNLWVKVAKLKYKLRDPLRPSEVGGVALGCGGGL